MKSPVNKVSNKGRMWVCFDCMPEHGTKEEYKIGERIGDKNYYYSDEKDEWGRHKSYGKCTEDEKEFYEDETEEATYWDAMSAVYDDF